MKGLLYILFIFILNLSELSAQIHYDYGKDLYAQANNNKFESFSSGGHHNANFVEIDLNNDGNQDLIILERYPYKLETYIHNGLSGINSSYTLNQKYSTSLHQNFDHYLLARDMNCDGVLDLIDRGGGGVRIHFGYYDSNVYKISYSNEPSYYDPVQGHYANMYVSPNGEIPLITDIDGDGDIDIIALQFFLPGVNFYKNYQVENNLACDSNFYQIESWCYGNLQHFSCEWGNNNLCKNDGSGKTTHSSLVALLDIDMDLDGDLDILSSASTCTNLNLLYNNGNDTSPNYSTQDTIWPPYSPLNLSLYPSPFKIDYDHDGNMDIIASSNDFSGYSKNSFIALKNSGSNNFYKDSISSINRLYFDGGSYSRTVLFDQDFDGDVDLFVAVDSSYDQQGRVGSHIIYFKNIGNQNTPKFDLVDQDWLGLSNLGLQNIHPAFGDVNNDGKIDLIIGHKDGMKYKLNQAATPTSLPFYTSSTPDFIPFQQSQTKLPTRPLNHITPCFGDVNFDGYQDIVIGEKYGNLYLFLNNGNNNSISYDLQIDPYGYIDVSGDNDPLYNPQLSYEGYSVPWIGQIDSTGKNKILLGNYDGYFISYEMDSNYTSIFTNSDTIQTDYPWNIQNSSPCVATMYGGNSKTLVSGNFYGGVLSFDYQYKDSTIAIKNLKDIGEVNLYPNPTSSNIYIAENNNIRWPVHFELINSLGKVVLRGDLKNNSTPIEIKGFAEQLYILYLKDAKGRPFKKIISYRP